MDEDEVEEVHEVYRGGQVHVLAEKCKTCIFRSVNDGRIQGLSPGRVAGMVLDARRDNSCIPCHSTIYEANVEPAVCRGFYDLPQRPLTLTLAERLGVVTFDSAPGRKLP